MLFHLLILLVHLEDAESTLMVGYENGVLMKNITGFSIIFHDFTCKWTAQNTQMTVIPILKVNRIHCIHKVVNRLFVFCPFRLPTLLLQDRNIHRWQNRQILI